MGTRVFDSLRSFEQFAYDRAALADPYLVNAVGLMGATIYGRARSLFGNEAELQPSLAPSTVQMRTHRWGYYRRPGTENPNATLLWTGGLRQSVEMMHLGLVAGVGSPDPVMQYQELGTLRIPPRRLLRKAAQEASAANWLVVRHYVAQLLDINIPGGGTVVAVLGGNVANQFTGARKRLSS